MGKICWRVRRYIYHPQTKFAKVMFLHVSVCPQGVGVVSQHAGVWPGGSPGPHRGEGVPRPTPEGVSRPTSRGVSRPTPRGVSQHALRQTPPSRQLLLRAVRILLECILVIACVWLPLATTAWVIDNMDVKFERTVEHYFKITTHTNQQVEFFQSLIFNYYWSIYTTW